MVLVKPQLHSSPTTKFSRVEVVRASKRRGGRPHTLLLANRPQFYIRTTT